MCCAGGVKRRNRGALAAVIALVVVLGLGCRQPFAPELAELYLGDVLWAVLFFLLFAWGWPSARGWWLGVAALAVTELIELSQLYRAPWAERVRGTSWGGLLLGHGFSWSDVACLALGAALAVALDAIAAARRLKHPTGHGAGALDRAGAGRVRR